MSAAPDLSGQSWARPLLLLLLRLWRGGWPAVRWRRRRVGPPPLEPWTPVKVQPSQSGWCRGHVLGDAHQATSLVLFVLGPTQSILSLGSHINASVPCWGPLAVCQLAGSVCCNTTYWKLLPICTYVSGMSQPTTAAATRSPCF